MKRLFTVVLALALVALFAFSGAFAAEGKKEAKPQSWTGEVVDLGCYMGKGAKGEGHKECGMKCVSNGMPMGLLVGGNRVFVLTMNHDNGDPFTACKGMVGQQVKIGGTMSAKGGVQAIQVTSAEAAASPAK